MFHYRANANELNWISPSDLAMRRFCFFVSVIMTENQSNNRFPIVVSSCGWHSLTLNGNLLIGKMRIKQNQWKIVYCTFAWAKSFARCFYLWIVHTIMVIQSASWRIGAIIRTAHKWSLFTTWACFAFPTKMLSDTLTTSVIKRYEFTEQNRHLAHALTLSCHNSHQLNRFRRRIWDWDHWLHQLWLLFELIRIWFRRCKRNKKKK